MEGIENFLTTMHAILQRAERRHSTDTGSNAMSFVILSSNINLSFPLSTNLQILSRD